MIRKILTRVVLPVLILLLGAGCTGLLVLLTPKSERAAPPEKVTPVEVVAFERAPAAVEIRATGTVKPAQIVQIVPQVGGRIVSLSPQTVAGGRLRARDQLAKIEVADYLAALEGEEARLRQAELELAIEKSRGAIAEKEWALLDKLGEDLDPDLALRRPHLVTVAAAHKAAVASRDRARLNVVRTSLVAPFNAVVLEESVEIGQVVGPGAPVARLAGTDAFQVRVSVPVEQTASIELAVDGGEGSVATVVQRLRGQDVVRQGHVLRLEGSLDPQTRTAIAVVEIRDPLDPPEGMRPLRPEAFVDVIIQGRTVDGVARIPSGTLVDGRYVFVADDEDRLQRREVEVGWSTSDAVFLLDGLQEGDRVVLTQLSFPAVGMALAPKAPAPRADVAEG